MRTFRFVSVGIVTLALLLGPTAVVAQDEAGEGPGPYLAGKLVGLGSTDYDNPLECPEWVMPDGTQLPTPTLVNTVVGETTLLGPTTIVAQTCISFTEVLDNVTNGVFTMTGASGDELSGTWNGDCTPTVVDTGQQFMCTALNEVTGGTGMFEGATGLFRGNASYWNAGFTPEGLWRDSPTLWFIEGLVEY